MIHRQIRNIANAYLLVLGLVLILLVFITIRVVDVYYNNEANAILDKRIEQLESIYTNYSDAGYRLRALNAEQIDKNLVIRLEGIHDLLAQSTPTTEDLTDQINPIFGDLDQHRVDVVSKDDYIEFMEVAYGVQVEAFTARLNFHNATIDGLKWRIAEKYIESKDSILVIAEDISEIEGLEVAFDHDIEGRIEEHLLREPMDVSVMLVNDQEELIYCSEHEVIHDPTDHYDNLTGRSIMDIVHELKNGQFEYQIRDGNTFNDYYAITRMSKEYDAHIILSMRKKDITNKFGQNTGMFIQLLFVLLITACIWTVFRFRQILKHGEITQPGSTREKNSIF